MKSAAIFPQNYPIRRKLTIDEYKKTFGRKSGIHHRAADGIGQAAAVLFAREGATGFGMLTKRAKEDPGSFTEGSKGRDRKKNRCLRKLK